MYLSFLFYVQFLNPGCRGSIIVVGGSTSFTLALSWGGIQFAWSDPRTLVPLVIGITALLGFLLFERFIPKEPIVSSLLSSHHMKPI
jgi:hypothetical protein